MERIVLPELLDALPPRDESALRSRRDIRRLNGLMRHPRLMARALEKSLRDRPTRRIVELGAGDGHFILSVAERMRESRLDVEATLVDRLDVLDPQMRGRFAAVGWRIRAEIAEAMEWLRQAPPNSADVIISNLFFHQFGADELAEMLRLAARSAHTVIALEPRRGWLPDFLGRFLWVVGCGSVTRYDGRVSIRAGFAGLELSTLWPDTKYGDLSEGPVGLFTHRFLARRKG
jgi:Methyltransferase domain